MCSDSPLRRWPPPAGQSARDTISQLEAEGNRVIVTRQSRTPLDEAAVVSVNTGPDIWKQVWDSSGDDRILVRSGNVVYVTVK